MPDDLNAASPTARSPEPDVMRGVIPYLDLAGRAGEAADFYVRAFGAKDLGRMPEEGGSGRLLHVQLEVNGGALMMTDGCTSEGERAPRGFHLQLVVRDGDAWWSRAVEAGCTVVTPFERMFWGDRWGMLRDPFGLLWAVDEPAAAE